MTRPSMHCFVLTLFTTIVLTARGAGTEAESVTPFQSAVVVAVQKVRPGIVSIRIPKTVGQQDGTAGTGVIIHEAGFVLTNRHVVGSRKSVIVRLDDEKEYIGYVLQTEGNCDLALLRIHAPGVSFHWLPLDSSDHRPLMVGQDVIAIGHPYGYTYTVSRGIVSYMGREITMPTGEELTGLIQHDASINPGNSGGPLLDTTGCLVGINVALRDGAQGIAFALNMKTVRKFVGRHLGTQWLAKLKSQPHQHAAPPVRHTPKKDEPANGRPSMKIVNIAKEKPQTAGVADTNHPKQPDKPTASGGYVVQSDEAFQALIAKAAPVTQEASNPDNSNRRKPDALAGHVEDGASRVRGDSAPGNLNHAEIEQAGMGTGKPLLFAIIVLLIVIAGQQIAIFRRGSREAA